MMKTSAEILHHTMSNFIRVDSFWCDRGGILTNTERLMKAEQAVLEAVEKHVSYAGEICGCYFCTPFRHLQAVRKELGV
jgi:hypothetical protein